MADFVYALTHHRWDEDERHFALPNECAAALDLRSLPDCANQGVEAPALFVAMPPAITLDDTFHVLGRGDLRQLQPAARERSLWETVARHTPQGTTLADWLADHLLNGADPTGQSACKPLIPTTQGSLEILLDAHSRVWQRRFRFGSDPHTPQVQAVLQADFRSIFESAAQGRTTDEWLAEKVLDYWCEQYGLSKTDRAAWEQLIPSDLRTHVAGPVPHSTTISDNFNTADSDTLGPGLTWAEIGGGDWDVLSNQATLATSGNNNFYPARAESDLSSGDHYAECDVTTDRNSGPAARFSGSAETFYSFEMAGTTARLFKTVSGSRTQLTSQGGSTTDPARIECNGSSVAGFCGGAASGSTTDTAITGNTRCGLNGRAANPTATILDNFQAGDLGGSSSSTPSSSEPSSSSAPPSTSTPPTSSAAPSSEPPLPAATYTRRIIHHGTDPTSTGTLIDARAIAGCWFEMTRTGGLGPGEVALRDGFLSRNAIDIGDWISFEHHTGVRWYLGRVEERQATSPAVVTFRLEGPAIQLNEIFPGGFAGEGTPTRLGATDIFSFDPDRSYETWQTETHITDVVTWLLNQWVAPQTSIVYDAALVEPDPGPLVIWTWKFRGEESARTILKTLALVANGASWGVRADRKAFFVQKRSNVIAEFREGTDLTGLAERRTRDMLYNRLLLTGDYIYPESLGAGRPWRARWNFFDPASRATHGERRIRLWVPWIRADADALNFAREFFRLYAQPTTRYEFTTKREDRLLLPWTGRIRLKDRAGTQIALQHIDRVRVLFDHAPRFEITLGPPDPNTLWPEPPQDERWEIPEDQQQQGPSAPPTSLTDPSSVISSGSGSGSSSASSAPSGSSGSSAGSLPSSGGLPSDWSSSGDQTATSAPPSSGSDPGSTPPGSSGAGSTPASSSTPPSIPSSGPGSSDPSSSAGSSSPAPSSDDGSSNGSGCALGWALWRVVGGNWTVIENHCEAGIPAFPAIPAAPEGRETITCCFQF